MINQNARQKLFKCSKIEDTKGVTMTMTMTMTITYD